MRRFIPVLAALALIAGATSCEKKNNPDNQVTIKSITLPASLNSVLKEDVEGVPGSRKVKFILPKAVTETTFIPVFELSEHDVLSQYGKVLTSGTTPCKIATGDTLHISDDVSGISSNYVIEVVFDDGKAELTYAAFLAADNVLLPADVIPDRIEETMAVSVPGEAYMRNLTLTVKAGPNDVIKVNHASVGSNGKTLLDTGFPVEIKVTDDIAGTSSSYVIKIMPQTGMVIR